MKLARFENFGLNEAKKIILTKDEKLESANESATPAKLDQDWEEAYTVLSGFVYKNYIQPNDRAKFNAAEPEI